MVDNFNAMNLIDFEKSPTQIETASATLFECLCVGVVNQIWLEIFCMIKTN